MKWLLTEQRTPQNTPTYIFKLPERDKLHDVAHGGLASHGTQASVVPIQELHGGEVGPTHADDDNGHGQAGGVDDGVPGLVHVCDDSVGDDEENKVLLWKE